MIEEDKAYIVCVNEDHVHVSKSVLVACSKCKRNLWCTTHNTHLTPICMDCVKKLGGEKTLLIKRRDLMNAYKVINPPISFELFEKISIELGRVCIED